jgi:hypothetical protein
MLLLNTNLCGLSNLVVSAKDRMHSLNVVCLGCHLTRMHSKFQGCCRSLRGSLQGWTEMLHGYISHTVPKRRLKSNETGKDDLRTLEWFFPLVQGSAMNALAI